MNKLFKLTLCFTFALLLNISICYASTSEALNNSSYLSDYDNMFSNDIDSPYQKQLSEGHVDVPAKTITANVQDLYIPGKNNFDITINRNFNINASVGKRTYKIWVNGKTSLANTKDCIVVMKQGLLYMYILPMNYRCMKH